MGNISMAKLLLPIFIAAVLMAGPASSDFAADQKECKEQLLSLTPCLRFVSGESKAPTPQCCSVVAGKISTTLKCMCVLVKDRDEPGLGVKINPTLALSLPNLCHSPSNASRCIGLLGLSPSSKEAQVFVQFDKNSSQPNSGSVSPVESSSATPMRLGWHVNRKCELVLIWCLVLTWLLSL